MATRPVVEELAIMRPERGEVCRIFHSADRGRGGRSVVAPLTAATRLLRWRPEPRALSALAPRPCG